MGAHGRCAPDLTLKTLPRTHHVGRIAANTPRRFVGRERRDVRLSVCTNQRSFGGGPAAADIRLLPSGLVPLGRIG